MGVLLSVAGGSDLGLFEINEACELVQAAAHPEAKIIFGTTIDDALGDEVRITVIAAGFDGGSPKGKFLCQVLMRVHLLEELTQSRKTIHSLLR